MGYVVDRTHRRYSPSKADQIALCPGSVNMRDRVPPRARSEYAIEGEYAHLVLQAALENGVRSAKQAHEEYSEICLQPMDKRHGGPYEAFYSSVDMMLDEVYAILDEFPDAILFTERFVNPPCEPAPGEAGGYCDCAVYAPSIYRLWVWDYKHGAGVVKENTTKQIKQYGAGFLFDPQSPLLEVLVQPQEVQTITLGVVQPRAFHPEGEIRKVDATYYELYAYLEEMDNNIRNAQRVDAPLVPAEDGAGQCQFCDAKVECPARQQLMLAHAQTHFARVRDVIPANLKPLDVLTPEDYAWGSNAFPLIEKYISEFYERRNQLMREGYKVPGFKFVEAEARRQYYDGIPEAERSKRIAEMAGVDERELWSLKFITMSEAEKLVKRAARANAPRGQKDQAAEDAGKAFALLLDKKSTGNWTVVPESDPRPAVMHGADNFTQVAGLIAPPTGE